ncbi:MAG: hypothetical protein MPJ24_11385 [Pirellulaceae bacterium]|nr:hypothetical protein [Pirellulaceae bacterium]
MVRSFLFFAKTETKEGLDLTYQPWEIGLLVLAVCVAVYMVLNLFFRFDTRKKKLSTDSPFCEKKGLAAYVALLKLLGPKEELFMKVHVGALFPNEQTFNPIIPSFEDEWFDFVLCTFDSSRKPTPVAAIQLVNENGLVEGARAVTQVVDLTLPTGKTFVYLVSSLEEIAEARSLDDLFAD